MRPYYCSSTQPLDQTQRPMLHPHDLISRLGKLSSHASRQLLTESRQQTADSIHAWVSRLLPEGKKPSVSRPFNYLKAVAVTTAILGFISFFTIAAPYLLPLIQNRNLWAAVSLIAVLLFTSGHMFNHIRKVPYVSGDGKGGISYFAGGFQNQFGLETQIIAAICRFYFTHQKLRHNPLTITQTVSYPSQQFPSPSRSLA
jgi:oligosaccharyltransferase complex subunit gamma